MTRKLWPQCVALLVSVVLAAPLWAQDEPRNPPPGEAEAKQPPQPPGKPEGGRGPAAKPPRPRGDRPGDVGGGAGPNFVPPKPDSPPGFGGPQGPPGGGPGFGGPGFGGPPGPPGGVGGGPGMPGGARRGPGGPGMGGPGMPGIPGMAPGGAGMGMMPGMGRGMDWEHLKANDPEMYDLEVSDHELERKTFELSTQFRNAPTDKRGELKKQIQEQVGKHFEVRQKKRQLQLTRMEKELQRIKEELARRNEAREQIVGRRVTELTGDRGDLDF